MDQMAPIQVNPTDTVALEITIQHMQTILLALANQPYRDVVDLIRDLQAQVQTQLQSRRQE